MFGRKKNREEQLGTAFDRIYNYTYSNEKSIDEQFLELADILINNRPLVINFEEVNNTVEINRAVAFLSGVSYALNGEVHRLGRETFLFATEGCLKDGTLRYYLNDVARD